MIQIRISYFYQIRNFTRSMLPISTCASDPAWFHNNGKTYFDKNGVLNGIRCETIAEQTKRAIKDGCSCPCELRDKPHTSCAFLDTYRKYLDEIDFDAMIKEFKAMASNYQKMFNIQDEITIVLIVYEAPQNQCSERGALIDWMNSHGIECKELEYPIKKEIKETRRPSLKQLLSGLKKN